jgi:hypothetical protein
MKLYAVGSPAGPSVKVRRLMSISNRIMRVFIFLLFCFWSCVNEKFLLVVDSESEQSVLRKSAVEDIDTRSAVVVLVAVCDNGLR